MDWPRYKVILTCTDKYFFWQYVTISGVFVIADAISRRICCLLEQLDIGALCRMERSNMFLPGHSEEWKPENYSISIEQLRSSSSAASWIFFVSEISIFSFLQFLQLFIQVQCFLQNVWTSCWTFNYWNFLCNPFCGKCEVGHSFGSSMKSTTTYGSP